MLPARFPVGFNTSHSLYRRPQTAKTSPRKQYGRRHPSYTLHPIPCTLYFPPYTLHPIPCTLYFAPYTLHPPLSTLPSTLNLPPYTATQRPPTPSTPTPSTRGVEDVGFRYRVEGIGWKGGWRVEGARPQPHTNPTPKTLQYLQQRHSACAYIPDSLHVHTYIHIPGTLHVHTYLTLYMCTHTYTYQALCMCIHT